MRVSLRAFPFLVTFLFVALSFWVSAQPVALEIDESVARSVVLQKFGARGAQSLESWLDLLAAMEGVPESQQLEAINRFWNQSVEAKEDIDIWGVEDYWATPLETLGKGAADCEDFVIGKYFSLIRLGVSPEKLRLIYVRAQVAGQSIAHMVLGYYSEPNAEPLILDNLTGLIRRAGQRPDLTPVFSFNSEGVYVAGASPRSVDSISRWRNLLEKMRNEGFVP